MGFWSRVGNAFGIRSAATRPIDPSRFLASPGIFHSGWIPTGLTLTQDEATSVSTTWACIQAISTAIASSPWLVYGVQSRSRTYLPDDTLTFTLNQRANEEITAIAFREAMLFGALATGNSYAEIVRDAAQRVVGLVPLFPERMVLERDATTKRLVYTYQDPTGGTVRLTSRDVFHLRGPVSVSGLLGDSIVGRAARGIALSAAAERYSLALPDERDRAKRRAQVPAEARPEVPRADPGAMGRPDLGTEGCGQAAHPRRRDGVAIPLGGSRQGSARAPHSNGVSRISPDTSPSRS